MSNLFLTQSDTKLGINGGSVVVTPLNGGEPQTLPFANVESISVFGTPQISTQLLRKCIEANVPVFYYSGDGRYFGALCNSKRIDPLRHKRQILATDNAFFSLCLAKQVVAAKISNGITLVKSYGNRYVFSKSQLAPMFHSLEYLPSASILSELMGFEGNAAKAYFLCLSSLMEGSGFEFKGRSSRPPRDPFNSMLSFGYSLLFNNIIGAIERHGLHPYFAFLHQLKNGHAALASDLIEDSRALVVDKTIIDLILAEEVDAQGFYKNADGAIYMSRRVMKTVADAISQAMLESHPLFASAGDNKKYSFQSALDKKIVSLVNAIDTLDPSKYQPFIWEVNDVQNQQT